MSDQQKLKRPCRCQGPTTAEHEAGADNCMFTVLTPPPKVQTFDTAMLARAELSAHERIDALEVRMMALEVAAAVSDDAPHCPRCNGKGKLWQLSMDAYSRLVAVPCDVCGPEGR